MLRVFLVIDDYNELIYLQSLLKKLGLDVEGVQNQKKYADMSLGFNPHILITSAKGKKVDGLQLTQSLYRQRGYPKVIALRSSSFPINEADFRDSGVDEILDSPVNPRKLILAIASLGGVDETALLEKYSKIKGQAHDTEEAQTFVGSYDENGQPIESPNKILKNISDLVHVAGGPNSSEDREQIPGFNQTGDAGIDQLGRSDQSSNRHTEKISNSFNEGSASSTSRDISGSDSAAGRDSSFGDGLSDEGALDGRSRGAPSEGADKQSRDGGHNPDSSQTSVENTAIKSSRSGRDDAPFGESQGKGPAPKSERETKYEAWAAKLGPLEPKHFVRDRILEFNKKIRTDNVVEDIDEIEDERKTFVKALFRSGAKRR